MHAFNNRVEGLHHVTPFVQLQQTAVLSDGVVVSYLHKHSADHSPPVEGWRAKPDGVVVWVLYQLIPLLWRGGGRSPTGWLPRICTSIVPNHSPPVEGR